MQLEEKSRRTIVRPTMFCGRNKSRRGVSRKYNVEMDVIIQNWT